MPAWLLALINPLNWLKLLDLAKRVTGLIDQLTEYLKKRKSQKAKEKIDKASDKIDQVKESQPDNLKAQADALCELEKVTNPNSNCDK